MARRTTGPEIKPVLTRPTPVFGDVIFYVEVSGTLPKHKTPEVGSPYRGAEAGDWPDHKLVFIAPQTPDSWERHYYAADRENQDEYNFEHVAADMGEARYSVVRRRYVTPRADYDPDEETQGNAMPDVPADRFPGEWVLSGRQQTRIDVQELDSLYVAEIRTYVQRATLSELALHPATGRVTQESLDLYFRGELIDSTAVETLAADTANDYWGLQSDGTLRSVRQLTADWWAITTGQVVPDNATNSAANPARARVVERVTPLGTDVIFSEVGTMPSPAPAYGSAHYDTTNWPNHKLAHIEPADETGLLHKFWYVADRASQDNYNFKDDEGQRLTRTYVIKRSDYLNRATYLAGLPAVGTADGVFTQYVFAGESAIRLDNPLDGIYVGVERIYLPPVKTDIEYDEALERNVVITRTIIPHGTGVGAASAGSITEIQDINTWYDVEVTRELEGLGSITFPVELDTVPADVPHRLPPVLVSVETYCAAALADSTTAPRSMSEDFAFDYKLQDPLDGPYEGRILRFLTDDPDALRATYPQFRITAARETIFIGRAWFYASTKGNSTHAQTQIIELPRSIHGEITITPPDNPYGADQVITSSLDATPNYASIVAGGYQTVGYEPKKAPLKLWIVEVIQVNFTGVYA